MNKMKISNGYGKNSVKYELSRIFQEISSGLKDKWSLKNKASRVCIMSIIDVEGTAYPKCNDKWVTGKRFVCKKCSRLYHRLKQQPIKKCTHVYQNGTPCGKIYQDRDEICSDHLCSCVKDELRAYYPAYAVVCSQKAGLPRLPKDIWKIIFKYQWPSLIRIPNKHLYCNILCFTDKNLYPDMKMVDHHDSVFCKSDLLEGWTKSRFCTIVLNRGPYSVCKYCRYLSYSNGKPIQYLG